MKKEKIIAGVLAVATIASSVPAMTTEAVTPPGINSKFDYELNVEPVSNSQLKISVFGAVIGILLSILFSTPVGATIVIVDMGIFFLFSFIGKFCLRG